MCYLLFFCFVARQEVYKGVTADPELLFFSTCGNSACCGVFLEEGAEYLIGLYGGDGAGGDLFAESCGLLRGWDDAFDHELKGCESDPCNGSCEEYEVSLCLPPYVCVRQRVLFVVAAKTAAKTSESCSSTPDERFVSISVRNAKRANLRSTCTLVRSHPYYHAHPGKELRVFFRPRDHLLELTGQVPFGL